MLTVEFGLSLEEVRLLSIEQYYFFCDYARIKELERRRDLLDTMVLAQHSKNPGHEIQRLNAMLNRLESGATLDATTILESHMDATMGDAIDTSSDDALIALGFDKVS